jgi:hypothetical protein
MSWLADAFVDLRQRIQNRWTDYFHGDPHEAKERPYVLDELLRPSSWLAFGLSFIFVNLIVWLFRPPEWFVLLLLGGFGILGQKLFMDVWFTSSRKKPEKRIEGDE